MSHSLWLVAILVWPHYVNDIYLTLLQAGRPSILWLLDVVVYTLIPAFTLRILIKTRNLALGDLGFANGPRLTAVMCGIVFGLLSHPLMMSGLSVAREMMPWYAFRGYGFPTEQPLRGILVGYAAVSAGVLEEVIYRGVLISQLRQHIGSGIVVVFFSCLVFSGIHWGEGPSKLIVTFLWGIVPAAWFYKTRDVWAPIVAHTSFLLLAFTRHP